MPTWQEIKGKWTHLAAVDHMAGLKRCYFNSWWAEPFDYSTEGMVALLVYQQQLDITSALDRSQNSTVKTKETLGPVALVYVQVCFEATLILQLHLILWMILILTFIHSFITNERSATTANVNMSSHAGRDEEQNSGLSPLYGLSYPSTPLFQGRELVSNSRSKINIQYSGAYWTVTVVFRIYRLWPTLIIIGGREIRISRTRSFP